MAGDWIKVERAVLTKPEVLEIADRLEIDRHAVVGKLLEVWFWFDEQTQNGNAANVTHVTLLRFIDERVGVTGFGAEMEKAGWLTNSSMPNFERHNGESAKKRAVTAKRVKRFRNAQSDTPPLPEKRREEGNYVGVCSSGTSNPENPTPPQERQAGSRRRNGYSQAAREVLAFLNEKTGKSFREVEANLRPIEARLESGVTPTRCRQVIARKVRDWKDREDMRQYLRPATLFGPTNFEQYLGEMPPEPSLLDRFEAAGGGEGGPS